jgi:uncharacterized membrane protein YfcA
VFGLPVITDPLFYAVAIPAVLMVGITKTGVGGSNALGVSLMSFVIAVPQATAILLPILCLTDLFGLWVFRGKWDWRNLKIMIPGATVGMIVGTLTFRYLDSAMVKALVGGVAIWFAVAQFAPMIRKREVAPSGPDAVKGNFWAAVAGFTSFISHAGQPPYSIYMVPQRLDKTIFLGTTAFFFAYVNYFKLVPFWWLGQLNLANIATSLVLVPLVPVGLGIGLWIQRQLSPAMFYKVVLVLLALTGVKLIVDAAIELI